MNRYTEISTSYLSKNLKLFLIRGRPEISITALVLLNFKETEVAFPLDEVKRFDKFQFVLGNYPSDKELPCGRCI